MLGAMMLRQDIFWAELDGFLLFCAATTTAERPRFIALSFKMGLLIPQPIEKARRILFEVTNWHRS
jgi:hypothetical protein